jgi:hypothetical protein
MSAVILSFSTYFIVRHGAALQAENTERTESMRKELRRRGEAVGRNVALASERAVAVLDYLFLSEIITGTVSNDTETLYGYIVDKDGKVLVHSDASEAGKQKKDIPKISSTPVQSRVVGIGEKTVLEVFATIDVGGTPWGQVCFGLSMQRLELTISLSEARAEDAMRQDIVATLVAAFLLLIVASVLGTIIARRMAGPIMSLIAGVGRVRRGILANLAKTSRGCQPAQE